MPPLHEGGSQLDSSIPNRSAKARPPPLSRSLLFVSKLPCAAIKSRKMEASSGDKDVQCVNTLQTYQLTFSSASRFLSDG